MTEISPEILSMARERRAARIREQTEWQQSQVDRQRRTSEATEAQQKEVDERRDALARLLGDARLVGDLALQNNVQPSLRIIGTTHEPRRAWWGGTRLRRSASPALPGWQLSRTRTTSREVPVPYAWVDTESNSPYPNKVAYTVPGTRSLQRIVMLGIDANLYIADCEPKETHVSTASLSEDSVLASNPLLLHSDVDITCLPEVEQLQDSQQGLAVLVEAYSLADLS